MKPTIKESEARRLLDEGAERYEQAGHSRARAEALAAVDIQERYTLDIDSEGAAITVTVDVVGGYRCKDTNPDACGCNDSTDGSCGSCPHSERMNKQEE